MRPEASSSAGFKVDRCFEGHRLAADCQARAYEQVLPVAGRSEFAMEPVNQAAGTGVKINTLTEEGAAA
jgi:hypothetical protein